MTLISRILGMVRDIVSAIAFGTSWQWDGFIYAFMIPNFFRRIVGEGALSSAFIPVYNEVAEKHGKSEAFRFANVTLTFLICGLIVFVLSIEGILTLLLQFSVFSETITLTLNLLRILFPYLCFISIFAFGMGILNSHRHFLAPALGPILLNGIWIVSILWLIPKAGPNYENQLHLLSYAILSVGLFYLVLEIPPLYKIGFRPKWIWDRANESFKKVLKLLFPVLLSFAIMQINILVDMTLGIVIGPGANSSLWYGTRLMQFPLGIFAIAMGTALLPLMSQQIANGEKSEAKTTMSFALRNIFFIIIPSSVGFIVLSPYIVKLLFQYGQFNAISTLRTSHVLIGYAIGLFAYAGLKIVTTGYYATQDSKTPMKIGVVALVLNVVFNLILMHPLKEAGLALATALSAIIQFALLIYFYPKKVAEFPLTETLKSFIRILIASILMGGVCYFSIHFLQDSFSGTSVLSQAIQVLGAIATGTIFYLAVCFLGRVREMKEAVQWLKNKKLQSSV